MALSASESYLSGQALTKRDVLPRCSAYWIQAISAFLLLLGKVKKKKKKTENV